MKSFPNFSRSKIIDIYDTIIELYSNDQIELLKAAEKATISDSSSFIINSGSIDTQISEIRNLMQRTADNYGRNLLVKWIEELYSHLCQNGGAHGFSISDFLALCKIDIDSKTTINFDSNSRWKMIWYLNATEEEKISLDIRNISVSSKAIVPNYIIQYINQAISAYNNKSYLTSLAMISIVLEGTLRDALEVKGYSYNSNTQKEDVYAIEDMEVYQYNDGFEVKFQTPMQKPYTDFLTEQGKTNPEVVRIKRYKSNNKWKLELRNVDYLMEYWSTDQIITPATGIVKIGGLGTALQIARGSAEILTNSILPQDTDSVFQLVRNNLIHLSGTALQNPINSLGGITLEEFSANQPRVFDAIWSICVTVDKLYNKIAENTL